MVWKKAQELGGMEDSMADVSTGTARGVAAQQSEVCVKAKNSGRPAQLNVWGPVVGGWGEHGVKYAIVEFLDGIASGAYDDSETKLVFGIGTTERKLTLKLRKHPDGAEYIAFGNSSGDEPPIIVQSASAAKTAGEQRLMVEQRKILHTSGAPMLLEYQLRRFVMNPDVTMLIVNFAPGLGELYIWKKPDGYGIAGHRLPFTEESWNWHPHS